MPWVANYVKNYKNYRIRAARVIINSSYAVCSSSLLEALDWYKLYIDRMKQKAILMHKTINKRTPQYLQEIFSFNKHVYNLRDSDNKLIVPGPRTDYLKHSFSYGGAMLWNGLPGPLRSTANLTVFKAGLELLYSNHSDSHTAIR